VILAVVNPATIKAALFVVKNWKKFLPVVLILVLLPIILMNLAVTALFSWVGWKTDEPMKLEPYQQFAAQVEHDTEGRERISWVDMLAIDLGYHHSQVGDLDIPMMKNAFYHDVYVPEQGTHPGYWDKKALSFSEVVSYLHMDQDQINLALQAKSVLLADAGSTTDSSGVTIVGGEGQSFNVTQVHDIMRQYLGTSYVWGGRNPSQGGFDCSGLMEYAFGRIGINLSGNAQTQFNNTIPVPEDQIKPGDLVFFSTYRAGASHVGMYVGNGKFINSNDNGLEYSSVNTWKSLYPFLGFRRVR
jgi:cell wall-associated NlpC family hydrolase